MTVAIREIPLSLQVSLSIFFSRLVDKRRETVQDREMSRPKETEVKESKWERKGDVGGEKERRKKEKVAKQKRKSIPVTPVSPMLGALPVGVKKIQYHGEKKAIFILKKQGG